MNSSWEAQRLSNAQLKQAAAAACVSERLVVPHSTVFVDRGTTFSWLSEEFFRNANALAPATIATTSADVLHRFLAWPWERHVLDLWLIGGRYIPGYYSFDGMWSRFGGPADSSDIAFDRAFIGVAAIGCNGALMASISDLIEVKQNVMAASKEVVVVCDETKLQARAMRSSQAFAVLSVSADGEFFLSMDRYPGLRIAARIVMGVSSSSWQCEPGHLFLAAAQRSRAVEKRALILAHPE